MLIPMAFTNEIGNEGLIFDNFCLFQPAYRCPLSVSDCRLTYTCIGRR